jgi:hypothetical protein
MDGEEAEGDKVRLTHCGGSDAYFGSRKAGVLASNQVRFSVLCMGKLAHGSGSGGK